MSKNRYVVCVRKDKVIYKIFSIYLLSDGSFKVDLPHVYFEKGCIVSFTPEYGKKRSLAKMEKSFIVNNKPQLSIHSSGFVQFSGPGIKSGEESIGNKMKSKGLGLYSAPIENPIITGPTFGITVFGLEFFPVLKIKTKDSILIEYVDIYNKKILKGEKYNSLSFDCFILDSKNKQYIRKHNEQEIISKIFPQFRDSKNPIFTFPIIRLKKSDSIIGIIPFHTYTGFANKFKSGFTLGSPAGEEFSDYTGRFFSMMATSFPMFDIFDSKDNLDYPVK